MLKGGKEIMAVLNGREYHCALDVTMEYIGGKWKTIILWYLRDGCKRFSELKRLIPDITDRMLTLQLREMEGNSMVGRKVYPEVPPRVEYFLTDFGKSLNPAIEELAKWGRKLIESQGQVVELDASLTESSKGKK